MAMDCPHCKDGGSKIYFTPTNYQAGALRWSSADIHASEAHGVPLPPQVMAELPGAIGRARAADAGTAAAFPTLCMFCRHPFDMSMQGNKEYMCYRCGRLQSAHDCDTFNARVRAGQSTAAVAQHAQPEVVPEPPRMPAKEPTYFKPGQKAATVRELYLRTLEALQHHPHVRTSVASAVACPAPGCGKPVSVGTYRLFSVSWAADTLHNALFHGKRLPPDVLHAVKTFLRTSMKGSTNVVRSHDLYRRGMTMQGH